MRACPWALLVSLILLVFSHSVVNYLSYKIARNSSPTSFYPSLSGRIRKLFLKYGQSLSLLRTAAGFNAEMHMFVCSFQLSSCRTLGWTIWMRRLNTFKAISLQLNVFSKPAPDSTSSPLPQTRRLGPGPSFSHSVGDSCSEATVFFSHSLGFLTCPSKLAALLTHSQASCIWHTWNIAICFHMSSSL